MHKEGKLITAEEAMCRLGQAMEQMKEYIDGRFLEYHPEEYKFPYDVPDEPANIYVYTYDSGTLYFTHEQQPGNSKYGNLKYSFTQRVDTGYDDDEDLCPWRTFKPTTVISDPIRAPRNMSFLFENFTASVDYSFLEKWKTTDVEHLWGTFRGCGIADVSPMKHWDVSKVTNMEEIFYNCSNVKTFEPLNDWNVSKVYQNWGAFNNTTGTRPSWGMDW